MKRLFLAFAALVVAQALVANADEQWPSKPIRLVVPGPPGGVVDVRARWIAERMAASLGQPVVVDNRAGAGGIIGTETAARSPPDGYTLAMIHQGTMTINPHLYPKLPYDPLSDFIPITQVGVGPLMLAVNPDVPVHSVAELIRLAKDRPGELTFGSPGVGTPPHLAGELFKRLAGIDVMHVPYKGGAQSASDLIAGHIAFTIEGGTVLLPHAQAGRVRPLAVTSAQRTALMPDLPAIAETLPGFEFTGWVGLAAPAGTPRPIIAKVYAAVVAATTSTEGRAWFASFSADPGGDPPDVFAASIRAEHGKWGKVIGAAGIRLE